MVIVVAVLVAHFVDKAFYTFKESSPDADQKVTYFAIALKLCLIIMIIYVFGRLRIAINGEPMLKLNTKIYVLHVLFLSAYFVFWVCYEIAFTFWELDPNSKHDNVGDTKLKVLAAVELSFNIISVTLGCLLFYMLD